MMYYCEHCKDAVEPTWYWEDIQGDESVRVPICPHCGALLVAEADTCPLCGDWKSEGAEVCPACYEELSDDFNKLLKRWVTANVDHSQAKDIIANLFMRD